MSKYEIEISDEDYNAIVDNKINENGVLNNSTMLWILGDIVNQIVD